jgi:hypothetical protein
MLDDKIRIQKGLTRLDSKTKYLTRINVNVLQLDLNSKLHRCLVGRGGLSTAHLKKRLGSIPDTWLIKGQWCEGLAKSKYFLGSIKASALCGTKEEIMPISSVLLWVKHLNKDEDQPGFFGSHRIKRVRRHKSHQSKTQQRQEKPKEASDMCP